MIVLTFEKARVTIIIEKNDIKIYNKMDKKGFG